MRHLADALRLVALSFLSTVSLCGCASSKPQSWSSTDPYLENANAKLEGRRAWIQFADGREVKEAERVSIDRTRIRWRVGSKAFEAPTESVVRVGVEPKERTGRIVAATIVTVGLMVVGGGPVSDPGLPLTPEEAKQRDQSAWVRVFAPLPGEVVFEAPRLRHRPVSAPQLPAEPPAGPPTALES